MVIFMCKLTSEQIQKLYNQHIDKKKLKVSKIIPEEIRDALKDYVTTKQLEHFGNVDFYNDIILAEEMFFTKVFEYGHLLALNAVQYEDKPYKWKLPKNIWNLIEKDIFPEMDEFLNACFNKDESREGKKLIHDRFKNIFIGLED